MKEKTRNDLKLMRAVFLVSLLTAAMIRLFPADNGAVVRISVDGEVTAEYDLFTERTVVIEGMRGFRNILVIKEGKADITDAGCPDRLCVRQKAVSRTGESIICLPNRVVVEITGADGNEVDTIAN